MARHDVTVMGAGVLGLAAGWEMARRGAKVRVLDRAGIGAGASGGVVGALAPHLPENWDPLKAAQFDSLLMANAFWAGVGAAGGIGTGYARLGRVQPIAANGLDRARARADQAQDVWQGHATWQVIAQVPGLPVPSASGWYVLDTLSARIAPRQACIALAAAIRATGGTVDIGTDPGPGPVVWATGAAGLVELDAGIAVKGQAAVLAADWRDAPQLSVGGLHVVPHADGTVAVGSTTEIGATDTGTDGQLDDVIDRVRALVPALADAPVIERWAGLRPRTHSRAPVLDRWPGHADHLVLNGGFKIGFGMAPLLARLTADWLLDGRDAVPDLFRLDRARHK